MDLPVCWDYTRFTVYGFQIYWGYLLGTSSIACLTYLIVMWRLKHQVNLNALKANHQKAQFSYQTRVTKLLAVVTLCTGLLFVTPCILYFMGLFQVFWPFYLWINNNVVSLDPLSTALVCVMSLNSSVNIVIYFIKNVELRHAIMDLLCIARFKHSIFTTTSVVAPINGSHAPANHGGTTWHRLSLQPQQVIPMVDL